MTLLFRDLHTCIACCSPGILSAADPPRYCAQAFNPSGSTLQSSSGATDVTPPPVVNFNCVKGFYKQTLDHFNTSDSRFFKQVFWVCDKSFPGNQQDQVRACHANTLWSGGAAVPGIMWIVFTLRS